MTRQQTESRFNRQEVKTLLTVDASLRSGYEVGGPLSGEGCGVGPGPGEGVACQDHAPRASVCAVGLDVRDPSGCAGGHGVGDADDQMVFEARGQRVLECGFPCEERSTGEFDDLGIRP